MTTKPTAPDRIIAKELRTIRKQFPRLADEPAAAASMSRLASLRTRYAELTRLINQQGGASAETLPLVSESRQVARACGVVETSLRNWFQFHPADALDSFGLLGEARRRLIERAKAAECIQGQAEPVPESCPLTGARLIRDARDRDNDEFN
jgi:hypothetical protein